MPATALAVTAERANIIRNAAHFGLKAVRFGVDFAAVKAHLRDVADAVAPSEARERLAGLGVRIIDGAARFLDARTVAVGDFTIAARRFVIATGSSPALPAIPGLAESAAPHQRDRVRSRRLSAPSHRHRRRLCRSRTGADVPAARRRRHRARSGDAAGRATIPNAPPSCSTRSNAKALRCASVSPSRRCGACWRGSRSISIRRWRRDHCRQSCSRRRGAPAECRRPRSRCRRHPLRAARHRRRPAAAHHQQARLRHRRRDRRAEIHPSRHLSRRARGPARAVPPADQASTITPSRP